MEQASRDKLLGFIKSFGLRGGVGSLARDAVEREGTLWLTDDQLRDIADDLARKHRFTQKLNRRNRQIAKMG